MDAENDHPLESRPPTEEDVLLLCRSLNRHQAKYVVVGGIAIIEQGFTRATEDIDLLIESSVENQNKVRQALEVLPDKAVREILDGDFEKYLVIRVADEVLVDLMISACGVRYEEVANEIETRMIQDVPIPFASAKLLLRLKQTYREKDVIDREFLQRKISGTL